jgi:hypothetical protein
MQCSTQDCTALHRAHSCCLLTIVLRYCGLCLLLQDVLNDAIVVGEALGLQQQAAAAVAALQQRMESAKALVAQLPPLQHPKVQRSVCACTLRSTAFSDLQVLLQVLHLQLQIMRTQVHCMHGNVDGCTVPCDKARIVTTLHTYSGRLLYVFIALSLLDCLLHA